MATFHSYIWNVCVYTLIMIYNSHIHTPLKNRLLFQVSLYEKTVMGEKAILKKIIQEE